MTTDLMTSRYKVINLYPYCQWEVGYILHVDADAELYGVDTGYPWSKYKVLQGEADKYPNIFQPLPWYAERVLEDMPEYIKHLDGSINRARTHLIAVPENDFFGFKDYEGELQDYNFTLPATHEEYLTFIQSKK